MNGCGRSPAALTLATICFLSLSAIALEPQHLIITVTGGVLILQPPSSTSLITEYNITSTVNSGPNAIIAGPNQVFWFVEYNTGKIGEFNASSKTFNDFPITKTGTTAPTPVSLANDTSGKIWFSDQNVPSVWSFDPKTTQFQQYPTNTANSKPTFILVDSTNKIWFTDTTANNVDMLDPLKNQTTKYPLPTANSGPVEMSQQKGTSFLWVTESYANKIARFDMSSPNAGFVEFTPNVSLMNSFGIVTDTSGNVWVSEHAGSSVTELITSNSTFRKYPTSQPVAFKTTSPAPLALDTRGRLWFVEHYGNKVGRLDMDTGSMNEFAIPTTGLAYSLRDTLDSQGNFWFTEYSANKIGEIPWNASSPISVGPSSTLNGVVDAGQTVSSRMILSNGLSSSITVNLGITSTFTPDGRTSATEISLSNSSVLLGPKQNLTILAKITPDPGLESGVYTAGVVATNGNISSLGLVFLHVRARFSLVSFLLTYLPAIVASATLVLVVTQVLSR